MKMIKGVNRQVFERIIFFVKPEYGNEDRAKLKKEAESYASSAGKPPKSRKTKKEIRYLIMQSILCLGAGAALTFLFSLVL